MRAQLPHPRAGLTLLELLVVLAILAITTAVVPLAWRSPRAPDGSALDGLTQSARREAIRRGEELRLRVDVDGTWVLAARDGTDILETGRIAIETATVPTTAVSLRVDALGTCRPGSDSEATNGASSSVSFDMLGCRFLPIATPASATR